MTTHDEDALLASQVMYYRASASDYLPRARKVPGFAELEEALVAFGASGNCLELACGPGTWTPTLLRTAATVTALDAAPEMLAVARSRVSDRRVTFEQADVFSWRPERLYDTVFFGFWRSHVPPERFAGFGELVRECLKPAGRVFFMDDAFRSPEELVEGPSSSSIRREARDGSAHNLVKVPYTPGVLQRRLAGLGWNIEVHPTAGALYWGSGRRT